MRGKANGEYFMVHGFRITPAYAGKSVHTLPLPIQLWDHPRLCGEKQDIQYLQYLSQGITPAYAGKRVEQNRQ